MSGLDFRATLSIKTMLKNFVSHIVQACLKTTFPQIGNTAIEK